MSGSEWQIGLDIQPDYLAVLGIQRLHHHWHIRFCWGKAVQLSNNNLDSFPNNIPEIATFLQEIRALLPRRISVRVSFPPEQTLNRLITLPAKGMAPSVADRYIKAAVVQIFPDGVEELAMDYCSKQIQNGNEVELTLARQQLVEQYLSLLSRAGFDIDVLELMPAALLPLLQQIVSSGDKALIMRTPRYWLWASKVGQLSSCDWALTGLNNDRLPEALRQHCDANMLQLYCSSYTSICPSAFVRFSPLEIFQRRGIRLPANPGRYCLAAGLALRADDSL